MEVNRQQFEDLYLTLRHARTYLICPAQISEAGLEEFDTQLDVMETMLGYEGPDAAQDIFDRFHRITGDTDMRFEHVQTKHRKAKPSLWQKLKAKLKGWPIGGKHSSK